MSNTDRPLDDNPAGTNRQPKGASALLFSILDRLQAAASQADRTHDNNPDPQAQHHATLGDILDQLDERAFGFILLLLALPCCLPFVYLLPQIVSLPMLALAGQLAAGRKHPWFPSALKNRQFVVTDFRNVLERAEKYLGWLENLSKPRFTAITGPFGVRLIGLLLLAPTASIMVPLPATNTVPGIGVAITALGLIERDGILVIGGLIIGLFWVAMLLFFGIEAAQYIKSFITNLL